MCFVKHLNIGNNTISKLLAKIFGKSTDAAETASLPEHARVIPRNEHDLTRKHVSDNALKVLYRLHRAGHAAFLVGGGVRDILIGQIPKDFDVATDARPEQVRRLFRNCRLIGRRFRLAHVYFGREIIEVATFRKHHQHGNKEEGHTKDGMIVRDNVYGTIEDDAERRDFTINALYYNIADFSVVDFTTGMQDLKDKTVRLIGDPHERYREDPVRILRAIRFMVKADFDLEVSTEAPIFELGHLLRNVPPARLFEEVLKLFLNGKAEKTFQKLRHYKLFAQLFPKTVEALESEEGDLVLNFLTIAFRNTDDRVAIGKPVTPAYILAALLWHPMVHLAQELQHQEIKRAMALQMATEEIIREQAQCIAIPRRFLIPMQEIWRLQTHLPHRHGHRADRLMERPRFRAAYDFLVMRAEAGEKVKRLADWWTQYQAVDDAERQQMLDGLHQPHKANKTNNARNRQPYNRRRRPSDKGGADRSSQS